ncbi:redoxin domain-containing protein [Zunongwangia sp.]|uniref:redoxin domain-containing protein n=1 Tax=Zunongwangia sp. TaxID=1965325 RepID=UPI003AA8779E
MKKAIFGFITLLIISCNEKPEKEFSLRGTTNGIEDGTLLYLTDMLDRKSIDSTTVEDNTFFFKTKLTKSPLQVVLHTEDHSQYRFLWLEQNTMDFDGTKADFRNANVTGSKLENLSQTLYKGIDTLAKEERTKKEIKFVEKNPNSVLSAYLLSTYTTTWGKKETKELFENFSEENKNSEYGNKISRYIELNIDPKIGDQYVDFEMKDINGKIKKLSDLRAKVILLEFWASWCVPCRMENPLLVKTYEEFNPKGFEVFAVSLDEDINSWKKAVEKDNLDWIQVSDLEGDENKASLIYGINSIPDSFLIDENGRIIARNLRGNKLNNKLFEIFESDSPRSEVVDKISRKFFKTLNTSNYKEIKTYFSPLTVPELTDSTLQNIIDKLDYSKELKLFDTKIISGRNNSVSLYRYKSTATSSFYIVLWYDKQNRITNIAFENITVQ